MDNYYVTLLSRDVSNVIEKTLKRQFLTILFYT